MTRDSCKQRQVVIGEHYPPVFELVIAGHYNTGMVGLVITGASNTSNNQIVFILSPIDNCHETEQIQYFPFPVLQNRASHTAYMIYTIFVNMI